LGKARAKSRCRKKQIKRQRPRFTEVKSVQLAPTVFTGKLGLGSTAQWQLNIFNNSLKIVYNRLKRELIIPLKTNGFEPLWVWRRVASNFFQTKTLIVFKQPIKEKENPGPVYSI
jgi:hypothetical protein